MIVSKAHWLFASEMCYSSCLIWLELFALTGIISNCICPKVQFLDLRNGMKLSAVMNFRFLEGIVAEVDGIKSLVFLENHDLHFFNYLFYNRKCWWQSDCFSNVGIRETCMKGRYIVPVKIKPKKLLVAFLLIIAGLWSQQITV